MAKKVRLKKRALEKVFCLISILFIIGCILFYGLRLIKYYKIYNPKIEEGEMLLSGAIVKNSPIVYEGDGLYITGGSYIYKGETVNNYIKYSGLLWRIVTIKNTNEIDIVLDDSINSLKWNKEITDFSSSDVYDYLNKRFIDAIDTDLLSKTKICLDTVNDITKITCDNFNIDGYVRLLDMTEFLNSVKESTYIGNNPIWLANRSTDMAYHSNTNNISLSNVTDTYLIKPVVTLNPTNRLVGGKGTKEDPFVIKEENTNEIKVGSYVKLDKDEWIVYEMDGANIKLELADLYKNITYRFDLSNSKYAITNDNSLAKYLNNDYYNSLSYKDKLIETEWYNGKYSDSYKDIEDDNVTAYVGLLNVSDFKFNDDIAGYYLITPVDDTNVYIYSDDIISSNITLSRAIRPTIMIKKANILSGTGVSTDPYVLEV